MAKKYSNPNQITMDFDAIMEEVFLMGDVHNIRYMLPKLYAEQHEDVAAAEKRFEVGKGYLFTNGTGTGKTYVGLGVASRFYNRGKKNILIVVPTEQKCVDWIEDGQTIGLMVYKLNGIQDQGYEISVTTYANFYQNDAINKTVWDLIIYDESHYLNQNEKGHATSALFKHKHIAKLPSAVKPMLMEHPEVAKFDGDGKLIHLDKTKYDEYLNHYVNSTKVLFLSATPFAYHKSIQYADGCLFDIEESIEDKSYEYNHGYNEANGFDKFMIEHFGYRMKYNKLTIPESGIDVNLLERNFFEKYKEAGIMSTRVLNVDMDYSRQFITLDSEIGNLIDKGISEFSKPEFQKEYPSLMKVLKRKYNYNFISQLIEVIKAKDIHIRIQQHLDLGRKVVVFHGYNNSLIEHPFKFDARELLTEEFMYMAQAVNKDIQKYQQNYPEYWNLDLSSLVNTREAIKRHFPKAMFFNGEVNKGIRKKYIREFNTDGSGYDLIIVQQAAGREGISLHDRTGMYQRALINLGLPTAPTAAIQIEGRIYRNGVMSNAVYEYITLQTSYERIAFGQKIAQRAKTAENLAMGNLARDLETAFKEGYVNSTFELPGPHQGTGGKESDRAMLEMSDFDKTKTYYWARGKKTAKNKASEGSDYFATPEPLGYKMVQWAHPISDERGLEPSAGHGAIARWFPGNTTNHFVEPSNILASELAVNSHGTIHQHRFEEYNIINKFEFIVMNPPFGTMAKLAMEHLHKAIRHLHYHGRLIALLPNSSSMQKRLDEFFDSEESQGYYFHGEIILPACCFERAGTTVSCKIIKIVRNESCDYPAKLDLSYVKDIKEFFTAIEYLDF